MGKYIETEDIYNKANWICKNLGGQIASQQIAKDLIETKGVIVIVDNGEFEAAGWAFNQAEFEAFTLPEDHRSKQFVVIERAEAEKATARPLHW